MKIQQTTFKDKTTAQKHLQKLAGFPANLVFVFASPEHFSAASWINELGSTFPEATLIGCSTAGEITADGVQEGSAVITAIRMEQSQIISGSTKLNGMADSHAAGQRLAQQMSPDLRGVLVFGQGVKINGSALVAGMSEILGKTIPITGGLAGDDGRFKQTWTLGPDGISDRAVVAIGLVGEAVRFGHGTFGGWVPFGPARKANRCSGNILYELNGEPALDFYKRQLGSYAQNLPTSGLMFPFAMLSEETNSIGLIRTILAIDESEGSLTLAGEIQEGSRLKLMHASTDNLVEGAANAASAVHETTKLAAPAVAILVSCVGRKFVMSNRVSEEIDTVAERLGKGIVLTGYYSYGEISPFVSGSSCQLHNQTMTITTIAESI